MEKEKSEIVGKDTLVEVHFPGKIEIELVQANELRHYEIFSWAATLILTITAGFWVAYCSGNPKSIELFWTAISFSLLFLFSLGAAIYYRTKVYHDSVIKIIKLSEFKSEK